jgi:prepilin-type N-terminal cleavage/methylation domain-containing protein
MSKLIKKSSQLKDSAKNSGFTLVELLVVIAIIGILSGILITTIDPVRQQNRSRNASIRAAISKAGHAVNVSKAATGSLPSGTQLGQELENISFQTPCTSTSSLNCKFSVSGTSLPKICGTDYVVPTSTGIAGTNQCYMRIVSYGSSGGGNLTAGKFRIVAAKFPISSSDANELYVFDSHLGLLECGIGINYTGTMNLTVVPAPHGNDNCSQVAEK